MALELRAHITGTVWKIEKKSGDPVKQGEVILILESMKMEMPLESPATGTLEALNCQEGDSVQEDQVLGTIV
jgi:biotin carboxyl carrier protein